MCGTIFVLQTVKHSFFLVFGHEMNISIFFCLWFCRCTRASVSDVGRLPSSRLSLFLSVLFLCYFSLSSFFFFFFLSFLCLFLSFFSFPFLYLFLFLFLLFACLLASFLTPFSGKTLLLQCFKALCGVGSVLALWAKKKSRKKEKRPKWTPPGCPKRAFFFYGKKAPSIRAFGQQTQLLAVRSAAHLSLPQSQAGFTL